MSKTGDQDESPELRERQGLRPQGSCQGEGKLFGGNSKREQAAQGEPGKTGSVQ